MNKKLYVACSLIAGSMMLSGCDGYDPFVDDNGDKIALLSVDLPYFDASYMIKVTDFLTGESPASNVNISLAGEYADNKGIITDLGRLRREFVVKGDNQLQLYLNPNFRVESGSPVTFELTGSNSRYLLLPYRVEHGTSGNCPVSLTAMPLSMSAQTMAQAKSVSGKRVIVYSQEQELEPMYLVGNDNGNGFIYDAMYHVPKAGTYYARTNDADIEQAGLVPFGGGTAVYDQLQLKAGDYVLSAYKKRTSANRSVVIALNSDEQTSAGFTYTIETGGRVYQGIVSGKLPFEQTIGQILVSADSPSAKVTLSASEPWVIGNEVVEIDNLYNSEQPERVEFDVHSMIQGSGKQLYHLDLKAVCPDHKEVNAALTKVFEFREGGIDDPQPHNWQTVMMDKGKCSVYLHNMTQHVVRVYIDNVKYEYEITTDPALADDIIGESVTRFELVGNSDGSVNVYATVSNDKVCSMM